MTPTVPTGISKRNRTPKSVDVSYTPGAGLWKPFWWHMDDTDRSFLDDMMPWSEAYRTYETSEMYNNLHLNLESEEEPPRRTYRKESMHLVS